MKMMICRSAAAVVLLLLLSSCGGGSGNPGSTSAGNFTHVAVVVLENQNFSSIIGNANMPFMNRLASSNSMAHQYFAKNNPYIGIYLMMTTRQYIYHDYTFTGNVTYTNITC